MPRSPDTVTWRSNSTLKLKRSGASVCFAIIIQTASRRTEAGHILEVCTETLKKNSMRGETLRVADTRGGAEHRPAFEIHLEIEVEALFLLAMLNAITLDGERVEASLHKCVKNYAIQTDDGHDIKRSEPLLIRTSTPAHKEICERIGTCGSSDKALQGVYDSTQWKELPYFCAEVTQSTLKTLQQLSCMLSASIPSVRYDPLSLLKSPEPVKPRCTPRSPPPLHLDEPSRGPKRLKSPPTPPRW